MKHLLKFSVMAMAVFIMAACSENPKDSEVIDEDLQHLKSTTPGMCKTNEYTLLAGQHIDAGTVTIENDGSYLYIKVCSYEGFQDVEENLKIQIGTTASLNLLKRPAAGHFPYKYSIDPELECFSVPPIPLSEITGKETCSADRIVIIVHADVVADGKAETAFSGEKTGAGNAWWYYISYRIACCL